MKEIIIEEKLLGGVYAQEVRGELIRCKDCKWFLSDDTCGNKRLSDQEDIATLGPEWFCADGEVKDDG